MRNFSACLISAILLFACSKPQQSKISDYQPEEFEGGWLLSEVQWISADTTVTFNPEQKGVFIFSEGSYSIQWSPSTNKRTPFKNLSEPEDTEVLTAFRSVVFNAGTYLYTDSTITATALIAKVPGFEGGKQYYSYSIIDEQLSLTMFDETYPNGDKPKWSGVWQTKFVLTPLKP